MLQCWSKGYKLGCGDGAVFIFSLEKEPVNHRKNGDIRFDFGIDPAKIGSVAVATGNE